jgi:DNA-directed RNA polymerase subunit M/transcription elongation factor TFIIS
MVKLVEAKSMEECVYFTNRNIGEKFNGNVRCWVFRQQCPKCKKAFMGKPVVDGKAKIRALEYVCPNCKYTVEKQAYEDTLIANVDYTCPACQFHGGMVLPFKRKKVEGVLTLRFPCEKCGGPIDVTKKMKEIKKKVKKGAVVEDVDVDEE